MTWGAYALLLVLGCVFATGCTASGLHLGAGMRVELATDGGFAAIPGLARPVLLDAVDLSPDHGAKLKRLVEAALAEKAQRGSTKAAPVPDGRRYHITILGDGARNEIEAADPMIPPAFEALMEFTRGNGRR